MMRDELLFEFLFSAEEDVLGLGKTFWLGHLGACQFESADDVGDLEEAVFGRCHSRDEFRPGGVDCKGLIEKRGKFTLAVFRKTSTNIIAYFLVDGKGAKEKMKAEIAPRQQRRLLRLPVTPVLPFVNEYYRKNFDCVQGGVECQARLID